MGFQDPLVGGIALRKAAIRSPNYAAGSLGWTINIDGSAEFNNLTIRGTFFGTNYIINSSGAFFYSGVPATGNLIASIASIAGTDSFGNAYPSGINSQSSTLFTDIASATISLGNIVAGVQDLTNAAQIASEGISSGLLITSGKTVAKPDKAALSLFPGTDNQPTGNTNAPFALVADIDLNSSADFHLAGSIQSADPATGNVLTWQAPGAGYSANWSGTTSFDGLGGGEALQFHRMVSDRVFWYGLFTSAAGAGTQVLTVPAGYFYTTKTTYGHCLRNRGGVIASVGIAISTAGAFLLTDAPSAGDEYLINCEIPLRHVP